jgi:hypothetical protein
MNVAFLAGAYYPNFEAVGYCAYQVHKCLSGSHDLTVIAFRNDAAQPWAEDVEGISIRRIETVMQRWRNRLNSPTGWYERILLQGLRIWGAARRLLAPTTVDWSLVRAYVRQLQALETPPQVIVPLVFPFEAALAALEFKCKNPETLVMPYVFDDFVDSGSLHTLRWAGMIKRRSHLQLERGLLERCQHVVAMRPLRRHFELHYSADLTGKVTYLEHPLLNEISAQDCPNLQGQVQLCFTGSLIRNVREPDYLLRILGAIETSMPVVANFYVMGNAAGKVVTKSVQPAVSVINHGRVSKHAADDAVASADILINLGERTGRQISSKIFEYISAGKPIVHLAFAECDAVIGIVEKYPLSLCLKADERSFIDNARKMSEFIELNCKKRVSWSEVSSLYPEALPGTTAAVFERLLQAAR